jgi:hypothetical protein
MVRAAQNLASQDVPFVMKKMNAPVVGLKLKSSPNWMMQELKFVNRNISNQLI